MNATRYALGDLRITFQGASLAAAYFEPDDTGSHSGPPDLTCARAEVPEVRALAPELRDAAVGYAQGALRILCRGGAFAVEVPGVRALVASDGRRVDVEVTAGTGGADGGDELASLLAIYLAARHHEVFLLHAGVVVPDGQPPFAIVGDSGAGKSTVTLGFAALGGEVLGDDVAFLARRQGSVRVLGIRRPPRLGEASLRAFPDARPLSARGPDGKRAVAFESFRARKVSAAATPRILLFPQITGAPTTTASPIATDDAFGLLLRASALLTLPDAPRVAEHLAVLRDVAVACAAYTVHLGADWLEAPHRAAAALLERVRRR